MPMTLNVGLSRKVGEPNYGSRGASVNLELELDNSLVEQPEQVIVDSVYGDPYFINTHNKYPF